MLAVTCLFSGQVDPGLATRADLAIAHDAEEAVQVREVKELHSPDLFFRDLELFGSRVEVGALTMPCRRSDATCHRGFFVDLNAHLALRVFVDLL